MPTQRFSSSPLFGLLLKFSRLFELYDYVVIRFICLDDVTVAIVEFTDVFGNVDLSMSQVVIW